MSVNLTPICFPSTPTHTLSVRYLIATCSCVCLLLLLNCCSWSPLSVSNPSSSLKAASAPALFVGLSLELRLSFLSQLNVPHMIHFIRTGLISREKRLGERAAVIRKGVGQRRQVTAYELIHPRAERIEDISKRCLSNLHLYQIQ